jgi:hypothetical protein
MLRAFALVAAVLALAGCQNPPEASPAEPAAAKPATPAPTEPAPAGGEVKPGMDMAAVQRAKGRPKDAKHLHGPNGEEVDVWVYSDGEVRFVNGVVAK